jgi:NADH-quinone oxidoreductase subunit E
LKTLSPEAFKKIDRELTKFPPDQRQSAVMAALTIAQTEQGWLSNDTMQEVAMHIGMPPIAVYEVASFYTMYNLKPPGKFKLTVCTNLPCQLMGATVCAEHAKKTLGIGYGETTADGLFTLKEGECFGACGDAPVFTVNNHDLRAKITPEKFDALVATLKKA